MYTYMYMYTYKSLLLSTPGVSCWKLCLAKDCIFICHFFTFGVILWQSSLSLSSSIWVYSCHPSLPSSSNDRPLLLTIILCHLSMYIINYCIIIFSNCFIQLFDFFSIIILFFSSNRLYISRICRILVIVYFINPMN